MQKGLDGLTIFGTNGEASSFSVGQKIQSIEFLLENRIDANNLLIGSGSASLEDAISLTKFSAKIKAKASLLIPPFYFKNVTDDGVLAYYRNVIESTGDNEFKFLLYNIPQHSGVTINFNTVSYTHLTLPTKA